MTSSKPALLSAALSSVLLCACAAPAGAPDADPAPRPIGADRDAHGCLPAAGQRWSEALGACVQPFSAGVRLNPVRKPANPSEAVFSSFVLFSPDAERAEVMSVEPALSGVLARERAKGGAERWRSGELVLERRSGLLELLKGTEVLYREESTKAGQD